MKRCIWFVLLLLLLATAVSAQEDQTIDLNLRRDFGSSIGGQIAGTFSYRVTAPDEIVRVEFLLDDMVIGVDEERPFRLQFQTSNYAPGTHTMSVIGYTADEQAYPSNTITRLFQSGRDSTNSTLWIVITIVLLSLGGRFLANWIANRNGTPTSNVTGLLGGAICPNCGRPFAIHLWSPHFFGNRLDRCPHCGKWNMVRRAPVSDLEAALKAMNEPAESLPSLPPEDDFKRRLDDSRFE